MYSQLHQQLYTFVPSNSQTAIKTLSVCYVASLTMNKGVLLLMQLTVGSNQSTYYVISLAFLFQSNKYFGIDDLLFVYTTTQHLTIDIHLIYRINIVKSACRYLLTNKQGLFGVEMMVMSLGTVLSISSRQCKEGSWARGSRRRCSRRAGSAGAGCGRGTPAGSAGAAGPRCWTSAGCVSVSFLLRS